MTQRMQTPGLGGMVGISAVLHLVFFFVAITLGNLREQFTPAKEVTYVDILDLPTANPKEGKGSAGQQAWIPPAPAASAPQAAPVAPKSEMSLPQKKAPQPTGESHADEEYLRKIQSLREKQEGRHEEAALEAIRARLAQSAPGDKGGKGSITGKGSDYASYVQMRLHLAFQLPGTQLKKGTEEVVELVIDPTGRIVSRQFSQQSTDPLFHAAVNRAIDGAQKALIPPPDKQTFTRQFRFRPEGVAAK